MHICTVTVALHTNILLISHFALFFSFSSPSAKAKAKPTQPLLSLITFFFPLIHTNTPTHTNTSTDPSSQNQHRPTIHTDLAPQNQLKINHKINQKSNIPTHGHTNKDREHFCELVAVGWCLEEIRMFGQTGTNRFGSVLVDRPVSTVVDHCL